MREVIATGNVLIAKAAIDCGCKIFLEVILLHQVLKLHMN